MTQAESLIDLFMTPGRRGALEAALESGRTASVYNLAGSSVAMMLAGMPRQRGPVLVVGDNADDAG